MWGAVRARSRRAAGLVAGLAVTAIASPALAQLCHDHGLAPAAPAPKPEVKEQSSAGTSTPVVPPPAPAISYAAGLGVETAQIAGGSYTGLSPRLAVRWRRLAAEASLPVFRLALGDTRTGLGDAILAASARLARVGGVDLTAVASASVPTGDHHHGFGMGHIMAMPGMVAAAGHTLRVTGTVTFGAALTGTGHEHMVNVVAPMNRTELTGGVAAAYAVTPTLAPELSAAMSEPIGDGVRRAAAGVGATAWFGAWQLRAAAQLGLAGDPYNTRVVLQGSVRLP